MSRAFLTVVALAFPSVVTAQQSPVYVGGALHLMTQMPSDDEHLGGTTRGGSVVVGVQVSRRWAVEFEPSFLGPYSWSYTYRPSTTGIADVTVRRHDSFFSFQLRRRAGVLEPVVGVSYVYGRISRHAVLRQGIPYFDDSASDHGLAAVAGLDAAVKCVQHFYVVPTFRLFARFPDSAEGPFQEQARTGALTFRYGAGVRVPF